MRKLISLILVIVVSMSCSGCIGNNDTNLINLYFKTKESNSLYVEEIKYSGSQNTVDMATFAVKELLENTIVAENPTLPVGTELLGLNVKDETANVNFSESFTSYTGVDELLARFSVVRTLCDIPGISMVSITVDSKPLVSNATGNEVGVLKKKDVVLDVDIVNQTTQTTTVNLFFATSNAMALKKESRRVETQNSISIEKTIISELVKGPTSPELTAVIPSGVKILNIETKDGVCYVNMSEEFVSKFTGGSGILTVYSIVNSLCGIESVQSVQILIEGEKGAEFGNFVFDEPIAPKFDIVAD